MIRRDRRARRKIANAFGSMGWILVLMLSSATGTGCDDGETQETNATTTSSSSATGGVGGQGGEGAAAGQGGTGGSMSSCGNGLIEPPEACDDENTSPGDGCDGGCLLEPGYTCDGEPSVCQLCSNGLIEGKEECDDGNGDIADGCGTTCQIELGYWCNGTPSVCTPGCGDGFLSPGEPCDDGNLTSDDGCSDVCTVEHGYACSGMPSMCTTMCGDGLLANVEACDDGNTSGGDGCDGSCTIEDGYACAAEPSVCTPGCGDGTIAGSEVCDDGDLTSGDGCSDTCAVEDGSVCSGMPSVCATQCGDGILAGTEACDDGNTAAGDCCSSQCKLEPGCEVEINDHQAEANDFGIVAINQVVKGLISSTDDVDYFSIAVPPGTRGTLAASTLDGFSTTCAAFTLDSELTIYDAQGAMLVFNDNTPNNLCSSAVAAGLQPGGYAVRVSRPKNAPPFDYSLAVQLDLAVCGDGKVAGIADEDCDDGNTAPGDGCSATCTIEVGYACSGMPSNCAAGCGNGIIAGPEACDDGDLVSADGCSAACEVETGFKCMGAPSICTTTCGDGVIAGAETCDDGNTASGDCCSSTCIAGPMCEIEHNDSAAQANDFAALSSGNEMVGFINPSNDKDYFLVQVPVGTVGTLTAQSQDGPVTTCGPMSLDTKLSIIDGNNLSLAEDDDGVPGTLCSLVTAKHLAQGSYFIEVAASELQPLATFDYSLAVTLDLAVCGNGAKETGEQCDDNNVANGDGCDSTCYTELPTESEPNNAFIETDGPYSPPILLKGSVIPNTDADFYSFTLPAYADLTVETFDIDGYGSCAPGLDTVITLYGPNQQVITADDENGINNCSRIDPVDDSAAQHLAPGTYHVRVRSYNNEASIPAYNLSVSFAALCGDGFIEGSEECEGPPPLCDPSCQNTPVCGDLLVDAPETCDDGNLLSGDGCNSSCQIEGPDVEPNNTLTEADARAQDPNPVLITGNQILAGSIGALNDHDIFKMTLATTSVLRLETFDATQLNCAAGTSTTLRLLDSTGSEIAVDNISGIGDCSALVYSVAAGTYYVEVGEFGNDATLNMYKLEVKLLATGGSESETNNTQATADVMGGNNVFMVGGHLQASDVDYYAITVPNGKSVRAEVVEGAAERCELNDVDSRLRLLDADGLVLVDDDDEGRGYCSLIDGTGLVPLQAEASTLAGGTYYLEVSASSAATASAAEFQYRLAVTTR